MPKKLLAIMQDSHYQEFELEPGKSYQVRPVNKGTMSKDRRDFCKIYTSTIPFLVESNLTGNEYNVLMTMLSKMNYDGVVDLTMREIADHVGIGQPNTSRHISKIVDNGLFFKETSKGRNIYHVNSNYFWKGHLKKNDQKESR